MFTWHLLQKLLGRFLIFLFGGALIGLLIGVVEGGLFGAILGVLMSAIPAGGFSRIDIIISSTIASAGTGAMIGGIIGVWVGGPTGALSLSVVAIVTILRGERDGRFPQAVAGAWRGGLLCALAGSVSGSLIFAIHEQWQNGASADLLTAALALEGGFYWGSIAGFSMGFFVGALAGGLGKTNWLNLPLRTVWRETKGKTAAFVSQP